MQMTITETEMMDILQMGFSERETRVGLRACNKSVIDATQWLLARRDTEERKKRERAQRRKIKKYGKTVSGDKINIELLTVLVSQGFEEEMAAEALKQSNNDADRSYYLLTSEPALLRLAVNNSKPPYFPTEEQMLEIMQMGFTRAEAYGTLKLTRGDIPSAIEKLLNGEGQQEQPLPPQPTTITTMGSNDLIPTAGESIVSDTNTDNNLPVPMVVEESQEEKERKEKDEKLKLEAENELIEDHEEDPLNAYDIDISAEAEFISHYLAIINASI